MSTEELRQAAKFMNEVGMAASMIEKGEEVPVNILLVGLPEEAEQGHQVVCSPMDMEEEGGFSEYIQLYYEIPIEIDGIDRISIFHVINEFNSLVPVGHFVYSDYVLCECIQSILEYSKLMEEILAGLASGMELEHALKIEGLEPFMEV